jgi:acetyl-CoA carboxylase carboxyl transferase subunit beta
MNAPDLLCALLDAGTFRSWDSAVTDVAAQPSYAASLARARSATGLDESVITGEGRLGGRRVAVAACEFGFLGGSIGAAAGERLTRAVERATAERLPLVVAPASGGTRMQEGTLAFLQMVKITAAVTAHKRSGLLYLVYLRHPTTGGVIASWASLGHLTLAEPGALIGFLGPRVHEALQGSPLPDGVQTAENLHAHGLVDAVIGPAALAGYLDRVLTAVAPGPRPAAGPPRPATAPPRDGPEHPPANPAWESVLRTREPGRPGPAELIRAAATDVVPVLQAGLILALARAGGQPCVFVGQDRGGPPPGVRALRLARRGMRLAEELRLPLVTVIDSAGADLSREAEEQGVAAEIARCIATLVNLRTPVLSVLLGQGAGGAALALLPADRVLAAQHGWLAPLAPEGASAIIYQDTAHAAELAERQGIGSADLLANGIVDRVIPETGDLCRDLGRALHQELGRLACLDDATRMDQRLRRYRHLGLPAPARSVTPDNQ